MVNVLLGLILGVVIIDYWWIFKIYTKLEEIIKKLEDNIK